MQPTNTTPSNITTEYTSYNNKELHPAHHVNIDNKIPNQSKYQSENNRDIIEYTIKSNEGDFYVYHCIGNADYDQRNFEESRETRMQTSEKTESEDIWFNKDVSDSLAKLYPTVIYKK